MTRMYEAAAEEQTDLLRVKDVAHRIALTYGIDLTKHRTQLIYLHRSRTLPCLVLDLC